MSYEMNGCGSDGACEENEPLEGWFDWLRRGQRLPRRARVQHVVPGRGRQQAGQAALAQRQQQAAQAALAQRRQQAAQAELAQRRQQAAQVQTELARRQQSMQAQALLQCRAALANCQQQAAGNGRGWSSVVALEPGMIDPYLAEAMRTRRLE